MRVYLDDNRPTPDGWVAARWPEDVIAHLDTGKVEVISLDYHLGDGRRRTGHDVLVWLEQAVLNGKVAAPQILIHTSDPVMHQKMTRLARVIMDYQRDAAE